MAGKIPDQPAVVRAECELTLRRALACAVDVVQNPSNLRRGEVCVDRQAGLCADLAFEPSRLKPGAKIGGAAVLPDDRVIDRQPRLSIPYDRRFALIRNPNRMDRSAVQSRAHDRFGGDPRLCRPNFPRIVLNPARLRIDLAEFLLGSRHDAPRAVEHDGARVGGALIQRQDVLAFHDCLRRFGRC
ncbi:hypothetical protein DFQ30_000701 [Apophysomyces sp. BC1015]|nr:hypothetical protein DFQ30_000701 [Apophysomyces sp. BC1015]